MRKNKTYYAVVNKNGSIAEDEYGPILARNMREAEHYLGEHRTKTGKDADIMIVSVVEVKK